MEDDAGKDEQDHDDREDGDDDGDADGGGEEEEAEEEKQEEKDEQRKGWKTERGRVVRPVEAAGFYLYRVTVDQRSCEYTAPSRTFFRSFLAAPLLLRSAFSPVLSPTKILLLLFPILFAENAIPPTETQPEPEAILEESEI